MKRTHLRPGVLIGLLLLLITVAACSGSGDDDATDTHGTPGATPSTTPGVTPTPEGDSFVSAISGGGSYGDEAAPPDLAGSEEDAAGEDSREVEEADIFVQDGDRLYILNMYRGLMILDVQDPDDPVILGRLALTGYPVEMYIRDERAYVVVSDYFTYWRVEDAASSASSFHGSLLAVVDVADPTAPELLGKISLEGYVSQTRAVGDVIYAVSTRYAYYSCSGSSDDTEDMTTVMSIDISDPTDPHMVDSISWPGSWAQVHATSHSFYVVEPDYNTSGSGVVVPVDTPDEEQPAATPVAAGPADTDAADDPEDPRPDVTPTPLEEPVDPTEPPDETPRPEAASYYVSHITYLDISDPQGTIVERGRIDVPGQTWDKFALDEFEDTFRIVTQKWDGVTSGTLSVIDVANPDELSLLAEMDIVLPVLESVTATRFDGIRGYIVTAERTDPLFIVDLSDPANPRLAGQVEMPGQLTHLEPLGDRIVALGQDNEDAGTWRFAVSLFDVSDMEAPLLLDREYIGDGDYSWSQATWDDKAFTLLPDDDDPDDLGLIAVPFYAYSYDEDWYYTTPTGGVQLLDFDRNELNRRGMVTHPGYVTRVRPVHGRLASMSSTRLLMIDIDDLDNPRVTRDLALARNVTDYVPMGDQGVQLVLPTWYDGEEQAMLRVVPGDDPDLLNDPLAEVDLTLDSGQLVPLSDTTFAVTSTWYDESWNATSRLEVYDLSGTDTLTSISSIELPDPIWNVSNGWYTYSYGSTGGYLVQSGSVLAYLNTGYDYYYAYPGDTGVDEDGGAETGDAGEAESEPGSARIKPDREETPRPEEEADAPHTELHIVDLTAPSMPELTSLAFDQSLFGLWADGSTLYATHAEPIEGESVARYYVDRIDLTDPGSPVVEAPVNIPGTALYTPDHGATLVTLDSQWATSDEGYQYLEYRLYAVALHGGRAVGLDRLDLPGYVQSVAFSGAAAYVLTQDYYWDATWEYECGYYGYPLHLRVIDLTDPTNLVEVDDQMLPISYGYLRAVQRGRLFIDGYGQGMLVYDIDTDPFAPEFETSLRTNGYVLQVRTDSDQALLPAGLYGVLTIPLP